MLSSLDARRRARRAPGTAPAARSLASLAAEAVEQVILASLEARYVVPEP
ncbi:MAG: hypothetical protein ACKO27_06275 [Ilumatobacteraceae bacterium]